MPSDHYVLSAGLPSPSSSAALQPGSGNKQSFSSNNPSKRSPPCVNAPGHPNPPAQLEFQWPVAQLPVLPPPSSRQNKGNNRSKTVRLSHQSIRSSITIVPEEKEENAPPKTGIELDRLTRRATNTYFATMDFPDMYSSPAASSSPSQSPSRSPSRYHPRHRASKSRIGSARSTQTSGNNAHFRLTHHQQVTVFIFQTLSAMREKLCVS